MWLMPCGKSGAFKPFPHTSDGSKSVRGPRGVPVTASLPAESRLTSTFLPDSGLTLLPWLLTVRIDCRLFDSHIQKCQQCGRSKAAHNGCRSMEVVLEIGFRLCLRERKHLVHLKARLWYHRHKRFHSGSRGEMNSQWISLFCGINYFPIWFKCFHWLLHNESDYLAILNRSEKAC